ncbi:hypothetical protein [Chitinivorax sp. B]|uniref:endo-beta-N-acetylglucosaminidase n=1 Tax=Chitinivorax sp. B TaxID=2502235 RepID=UPI0014855604|nr:hypothetical protein [Chitinivorax sp. B]
MNDSQWPYRTLPASGPSSIYLKTNGGRYSVEVGCQPKNEQCSITSGTNALINTPINIACKSAIPSAPGAKRSYAWALTSDFNSRQYPLLDALDLSSMEKEYPSPSTTRLETLSTARWAGQGSQPTSGLRDYSLLYRTEANTTPYIKAGSHAQYFNNWAFIRKMISFGGAVEEGSHIVAPTPDWVDAAHSHGVKIYGTVFIGADHRYTGLTDQLLGSGNCVENHDGTHRCDFNTPTIDKLTALAKRLNIDGWLLNIESGLEGDSFEVRQRRIQINNLISEKFPKTGVEYIVYSNVTTGLRGAIGDNDIADFGWYPPHDQGLDNATGVTDTVLNGKLPNTSTKSYLLYLDEPFTRNTPLDEPYRPYRQKAAQQTQCQYFNGVGNWPGLKQYTLAKFPINADTTKLICGGDTSAPTATRILKVSISSGVTVAMDVGTKDKPQVTECKNDNPNPAFWGQQCYFELPAQQGLSAKLTFSGSNFSMPLLYQGSHEGNYALFYGFRMYPLVGARWWWLMPDAANQQSQFSWIQQGLESWDCKTPVVGNTSSASKVTSCTVNFPAATGTFNVDTGLYGRPPYLNFMIDARYPAFYFTPQS